MRDVSNNASSQTGFKGEGPERTLILRDHAPATLDTIWEQREEVFSLGNEQHQLRTKYRVLYKVLQSVDEECEGFVNRVSQLETIELGGGWVASAAKDLVSR